MSTDTETGPDQEQQLRGQLIAEVRDLARVRVHRLAPRQLAALDTQTTASIRAMKTYLQGRPAGQQAAAQARDWERRAWAAQDRDVAAAQAGISPYAKAGGAPASDDPGAIAAQIHRASEAAVQASRRVAPAERPQADGYFHHENRIYKVATSQYGQSKGHLFARKLDEQTGEWMPAPGMTSYLRETERITAEKAIEIGRKVQASLDPSMALYGKCWICKRVLTDETSIANGKGPGPHAGMDD